MTAKEKEEMENQAFLTAMENMPAGEYPFADFKKIRTSLIKTFKDGVKYANSKASQRKA